MRHSYNFIDITGQRFGRLVALRYAPEWKVGYWRVRCDCGTEFVAEGSALRKGRTRSCGCLRQEFCRSLGKGGYGIKTYNGQKVYYIDDVPTLIDAVHGDTARGSIVQRDLTLKPCFIARFGNSFAHGDTLHDAMNDAQQKELEDSPLEERIARFVEDHPDPDALHPCNELYSWHNTLTGSCKMGRDQFVKEHGLDMEASYSVRYFIEITASAYGGDAIRQLAQAYGITPTP